jgi:hypothetical protein
MFRPDGSLMSLKRPVWGDSAADVERRRAEFATDAETRRFDLIRKIGAISLLGAASIGAVAMLGWIFGVDLLKSVVPGVITMKANTQVSSSPCLLRMSIPVSGERETGQCRLQFEVQRERFRDRRIRKRHPRDVSRL